MCREPYQQHLSYLDDFLNVYSDKPKFSLTWITTLAHSNNNALFHADDAFYRFFQKNKDIVSIFDSYDVIWSIFGEGDEGNPNQINLSLIIRIYLLRLIMEVDMRKYVKLRRASMKSTIHYYLCQCQPTYGKNIQQLIFSRIILKN